MSLTNEKMIQMFTNIVKIRMFEERVAELFAAGKIPGFVHLYVGEEAVATGVCANLRPSDYITSTHRGHGHLISKGGDLKLMMAELFGKKSGYCKGKGGSMHIADFSRGILGANGVVGGGFPIMVGAGLSIKLRKTDQVGMVFFGDGASNRGTFHEACNMAAVFKLPIVFVCENNGYASTSPADKMVAAGLADVARGPCGPRGGAAPARLSGFSFPIVPGVIGPEERLTGAARTRGGPPLGYSLSADFADYAASPKI